jgi:hypothetical protein
MNPASPVLFYVVTNGRTFGIWEAQEVNDQLLWLTRPSFHVVQSFPNRIEAEAYLQFVSAQSSSAGIDK